MTAVSPGLRLAAFAVVLVMIFGAGFGLGRAVGPVGTDPSPTGRHPAGVEHPVEAGHGEMGS
ncbi:MAG: hypothetical protein IPG97_04260 [Microthrixaceae bacterium]|nr:hypothetical protein [Microthrixaceae bacterium]